MTFVGMSDIISEKEAICMTEFEAERERLATLMDLATEFDYAASEGKETFTVEELQAFLRRYAEKVKVHK